MKRTAILFVCLGNICRSPMAAALTAHLAAGRGSGAAQRLLIASCGTGRWHEGNAADDRTLTTLANHGVVIDHTARQVRPETDFDEFDLIVAMDRQNRRDLLSLGAPSGKVRLMLAFDAASVGRPEEALDVPDPYLMDTGAFERVYQLLIRACNGLLDEVLT